MERPSVAVFAEYVGIEMDMAAQRAMDEAVVLVDDFIAGAFREVPLSIYQRVVLDTAHALYKRADSVTGTQQIVEVGSLTINKAARDPLQLSYPLLRRYVLPL